MWFWPALLKDVLWLNPDRCLRAGGGLFLVRWTSKKFSLSTKSKPANRLENTSGMHTNNLWKLAHSGIQFSLQCAVYNFLGNLVAHCDLANMKHDICILCTRNRNSSVLVCYSKSRHKLCFHPMSKRKQNRHFLVNWHWISLRKLGEATEYNNFHIWKMTWASERADKTQADARCLGTQLF